MMPNACSLSFQCYNCKELVLFHYNYTGKLDQNRYSDGLKAESIAFLFICLLIVVENLIVLMAIYKNKKFHMPMYYLLGNLTLSDLLAGFTYMLNIVLSGSNTLKLTPLLWFLREGGVFITLSASVFSLLAYRHRALLHHAQHQALPPCQTQPHVRADRRQLGAVAVARRPADYGLELSVSSRLVLHRPAAVR